MALLRADWRTGHMLCQRLFRTWSARLELSCKHLGSSSAQIPKGAEASSPGRDRKSYESNRGLPTQKMPTWMLEDGGSSLGFGSAQPQSTLAKLNLHIDVGCQASENEGQQVLASKRH